jgi:peptidoglycan hydrolase FlgJ
MADLAPAPDLLAPTPATAYELAKRRDIKATAEKFEASFLSIMVGQMFAGVETEAPFGGGTGEQMFKSFLAEAIGKQITRAGGVGVSAAVEAEMLKLQGLE